MSANLKNNVKILVSRKDKLLFIHKGGADDSWQLPTGQINQGQTAVAAAAEIASRWGIETSPPEFLSFNEVITEENDTHSLYLNFKAEFDSGRLITSGDQGAQWVRLDKIDMADLSRSDEEALDDYRRQQSDAGDLSGKYQRALADYQNLIKQSAKEKSEFAKFANRQLIESIIPVYDNLKTSMQFTEDADSRWLEGVKYVIEQFRSVLSEYGVEEIEAEGKTFDHDIMEAGETIDADKPKMDDKVAKVLRPGYKMRGKAIIPAKVAVYKYKKEK